MIPTQAAPFKWGEDYGKDILVDLNQLAHARGTGALFRDAMTRAYSEICRLRKRQSQTECLRPDEE